MSSSTFKKGVSEILKEWMRSMNHFLTTVFAYNQLQLQESQTVTEENFAKTIITTCLIHWKHAFFLAFLWNNNNRCSFLAVLANFSKKTFSWIGFAIWEGNKGSRVFFFNFNENKIQQIYFPFIFVRLSYEAEKEYLRNRTGASLCKSLPVGLFSSSFRVLRPIDIWKWWKYERRRWQHQSEQYTLCWKSNFCSKSRFWFSVEISKGWFYARCRLL